jgi:hypothetical protein
MSPQLKAALRSFATTFLATLLTLIPVASVVEGDFTWATAALISALTAAVRTTISALDPGQPLFGLTSKSE